MSAVELVLSSNVSFIVFKKIIIYKFNVVIEYIWAKDNPPPLEGVN
jgi:hypothetical protein